MLNRPELMPGLKFYFDAFNELCTERQLGMAVGLIPWSKIMEYGKHYDLEHYELDRLLKYVRVLESTMQKNIDKKKANKNG